MLRRAANFTNTMQTADQFLIKGEIHYLDELDLDDNGQPDPPPDLTAEALGVCERTAQSYRKISGGDLHKLSWYLINRPGCCRSQAERAWQTAWRKWKARQGIDF